MITPSEYLLATEEDTRDLAGILWSAVGRGGFLALNGELGAGKTTLTRYLLARAGVGQVTSPTFALLNVYDAGMPVYHFDFYRINSEDELFDIGYYEYLSEPGLAIVEWAGLFPDALPADRIELNIEFTETQTRKAILKVYGKPAGISN